MNRGVLGFVLLAGALHAAQPYSDRTHESKVFGEKRSYRIFLPPDYEASGKRYPVVYYFHGHSDRYTLERYDDGHDTVPKIADFVAHHDLIVVAVDGYVARDYTGFYGGSPYDIRAEGGDYDFGEYFLELANHIDSTYRTRTDRRYRATSGLSMGGFMSLYLSARYPDRIGSASAFNPGPEFYAGEKGRRSLWRPKDQVLNHQQTMIRLVRASGDYISQYHEETREAYAHTPSVSFEYRQDEYHRHWATSIGETLAFHMRAFENPALDVTPAEWNYTSAYRTFNAWGYRVSADGAGPAFFSLRHVTRRGFELTTRAWAPDGPAATCKEIDLETAPLYKPGANYALMDLASANGSVQRHETTAGPDGRLHLKHDCGGHVISIFGPGVSAASPVILPLTAKDVLRVLPGKPIEIPVRIYNPHNIPIRDLHVELSSEYPTVEVIRGTASRQQLNAGKIADLTSSFVARFAANNDGFARASLDLKLSYLGGPEKKEKIDVLIAPDEIPAPADLAILDGRTRTFSVFRQKGNQGGGEAISRTVTEGSGNGNGVLEPGEQATLWIRLKQGLDPFDKNNWCRAKVYADSLWLREIKDIEEDKQREWTSAKNRTSVIELSRDVPAGAEIPMLLDCESWSFEFTPDVRYGEEPLYQAFQFHRHHIFTWTWRAEH